MGLSTHIVEIIDKKQCDENKSKDEFLDIATGCFAGGEKAVKGTVEGIAFLLKLVLWEYPKWHIEQEIKTVKGIFNGDFAPSKIVAKIADTNLASREEALEIAKAYFKEFNKFTINLENNLRTHIKNFPCLPLEKQWDYICRGVTEVFLLVMSPSAFIKGFKLGYAGAKWTVETASAMKNFIQSLKVIDGAENMTVAQRLDTAAETMKLKVAAAEAAKLKIPAFESKEVLKLRNARVIEVTLPDGEKILQYHSKMKNPDGTIVDVVRELPLEAKTKSIDANSTLGKQIMNELATSKAGSGTLISIDINHLGQVNKFKHRLESGDQYLEAVANSIRKALRPGDILFKTGGDELTVIIANNNPKVIQNISQRMISEVDTSPRVRQIFQQELTDLSTRYNHLKAAKSYDDLSIEMKASYGEAQTFLAKSDFKSFQDAAKKEIQEKIKEQLPYRGSLSIGSALLKHDETVAVTKLRADKQADQVKASYKAARGFNIDKYRMESGEILKYPPNYKGPPVALEPK